MNPYLGISFCFISFFYSCNSHLKETKSTQSISKIVVHDTFPAEDSVHEKLRMLAPGIHPVFGYRFIISGDFNGDGKTEKLVEHFFSSINNQEINKFYSNLEDYEQLVKLTIEKQPSSFVISDNAFIDTLMISNGGQLFGLSYLKNEGDLNGDGTDEVSYVIDWADWSNLNTWHIVTFQKGKWKELYSFPIWDFQLPDLPETFNQYGLFGLQDKLVQFADSDTSINFEQQRLDFKGLVKKLSTNKIRIIYRNEEANLDTSVVDLQKCFKNKIR